MSATGEQGIRDTMEARLEALERERRESAYELAQLREANARLHEKVAALDAAQCAHLRATAASIASTRGPSRGSVVPGVEEAGSRRASRRGMLRTALGATAAVVGAGALLTTETSSASADQGPTQFADLNSNEVCVGVYGAGIGVDAATLSGTAIHAHTGAGYLARVRSNTSTPSMTTAVFAEGGSGYAIYATSQAAGFYAIYAEGVGANGLYSKSDNYSGVWAVSTTASGVTASSTSGYGLYASSSSNYGVYATSAATGKAAVSGNGTNGANGVIGNSDTHAGVWGTSTSGSGISGNSTSGSGVSGNSSSGHGVDASSSSSYGVYATSVAAGLAAVYGNGTNGANGVIGNSDTHAGLCGTSTSGYGVCAASTSNYGVYATSTATGLAAVSGNGTNGTNGVIGNSDTHAGVWGTSTSGSGVSGNSTSGYGVYASSADTYAVYATSTYSTGLYATGSTGVLASGTNAGVAAQSTNGYGVSAQGGRAPLYLAPSSTTGAPTGGNHRRGELLVDAAGVLWFCTTNGAPGVWKQVTLT